jgi:hypothetical protein
MRTRNLSAVPGYLLILMAILLASHLQNQVAILLASHL